VFERFTNRSRQAVVLAQKEATLLGHDYIGTEHLLLGLLAEDESVAARALRALDVTLDAARDQVRQIIGVGHHEQQPDRIPFTPRAKKVLELSLREALSLKSDYIGTEHLLLGLVTEGMGVGAQILVKLGTPAQTVRDKVAELTAAGPTTAGPTTAGPTTAGPNPVPAELPAPLFLRQRGDVTEIHRLLASIDRRLAAIEECLGIGGAPEEPGEAPPAAYDAE
jgi:ATP-dependent Clp protease ATP-binding subunit ClpC